MEEGSLSMQALSFLSARPTENNFAAHLGLEIDTQKSKEIIDFDGSLKK